MSTNPLQRIAELEAQVATLTAENQTLRSNGNVRVAINTLMAESFDKHGRLFREEVTGKIAGNITPFIENTIRRCKETEGKQTTLEDRFKAHEEAVGKTADAMTSAINKLRVDAEKGWKNHRAQIKKDFDTMSQVINWFRGEMETNGQKIKIAMVECQTAARACQDVARKMDTPTAEIMDHLGKIEEEGEAILERAAQHLSKTYGNLERPITRMAGAFLVLVLVFMLGLAWIIVKRNENQLVSNLQQLAEYSEGQKTEMKEVLDKTMEEAKESQIDREIKVKMWDYMMNSLTPQQRAEVISKYREQVNNAGLKRLADQMSSSYEQMNGKRK